ncbi:unnamed protein product [Paramecium sonneborni]|uniref:Uncharacterized protein n=1 Tax=Paramecium sonneborni TaxID=65129 RepID=A0A8S1QYS1_9CILI|nr:unnamed protein product [Paramecium sonneborni]
MNQSYNSAKQKLIEENFRSQKRAGMRMKQKIPIKLAIREKATLKLCNGMNRTNIKINVKSNKNDLSTNFKS